MDTLVDTYRQYGRNMHKQTGITTKTHTWTYLHNSPQTVHWQRMSLLKKHAWTVYFRKKDAKTNNVSYFSRFIHKQLILINKDATTAMETNIPETHQQTKKLQKQWPTDKHTKIYKRHTHEHTKKQTNKETNKQKTHP